MYVSGRNCAKSLLLSIPQKKSLILSKCNSLSLILPPYHVHSGTWPKISPAILLLPRSLLSFFLSILNYKILRHLTSHIHISQRLKVFEGKFNYYKINFSVRHKPQQILPINIKIRPLDVNFSHSLQNNSMNFFTEKTYLNFSNN